MLQIITKESPQGVRIEYVAYLQAATDKQLGQYRRELELDRERRQRGVHRIDPLGVAGVRR